VAGSRHIHDATNTPAWAKANDRGWSPRQSVRAAARRVAN